MPKSKNVESNDNSSLSAEETLRLNECLDVIRQQDLGYIAKGRALAEIKEARLWRAEFSNWGDFVATRLRDPESDDAISHSTVDRLINAAKLADKFSAEGLKVPANFGQARALLDIGVEKAFDVWHKALASGEKVTGALIRRLGGLETKPRPKPPTHGPKLRNTRIPLNRLSQAVAEGMLNEQDVEPEAGDVDEQEPLALYSGSIGVPADDPNIELLAGEMGLVPENGVFSFENADVPTLLRALADWIEVSGPKSFSIEGMMVEAAVENGGQS